MSGLSIAASVLIYQVNRAELPKWHHFDAADADIGRPPSPERSSRVCSTHKNPLSHYLSISPSWDGRAAAPWKWNDILELVNSRSIMTVLLGFHFRIIYHRADQ